MLGPFWSLAIEEQFYLIWPYCVWHLSEKALVRACAFGTLVALLLRSWAMTHATTDVAYVVYMNTLTRMDGLLAGAFCAIAIRDRFLLVRVQKVIPVAIVAVALGLAFIVFKEHGIWSDYDTMVYGHLLLAIGFGCLVLTAYRLNGSGTLFDRALRSRGLAVFGKYSYGLYVFQGFVLDLILRFFRAKPWWGHSIPYALAVALAWLAAPFLIAFLSYNVFEKRFLRPQYRER